MHTALVFLQFTMSLLLCLSVLVGMSVLIAKIDDWRSRPDKHQP